jgi:hypothetical protein
MSQTKYTMKKVEVVSKAEKAVWQERTEKLNKHKNYHVKNTYFPDRMDEWEAEYKQIEYDYNHRLYALNQIRHAVSRERELMQQEEEKQRLSARREKARKTREQNKSNSSLPPVRRSARISANKPTSVNSL